MKKIELLLQEKEHTCTCAVARMILQLKDIHLSEMEIEKQMKVDPIVGASAQQLIDFLKDKGIESELIVDSSIEVLKNDNSLKLLLFNLFGRISHVAIIDRILCDGLTLLDPATGKTHLKFSKLSNQWEADGIKKGFIKVKI